MSKMSEFALTIEDLYIEGMSCEDISIALQVPLEIVNHILPPEAFTDEEYELLQQGWDAYDGS